MKLKVLALTIHEQVARFPGDVIEVADDFDFGANLEKIEVIAEPEPKLKKAKAE